MNQTIIRLSLLLLLFISISTIQAQIEKGELVQGKLTGSEIASNEKHQYTINLKEDQFVFFKLMQKGIDLKVTTYNTLNEKIEAFDSPNWRNGYELGTITSDIKGQYIIEVESIDEQDHTGKYELFVQSIKPKAVTQNEQVDQLFTAWDTDGSPGAAISVVKEGAIIYKKGWGLANLEYNIPISPSSIFHIASISKQFTAFSILLLEKQGKLSLDDDIRKYIPEVPDFGKAITLRHLASHTSGLRDQWGLLMLAGWRLDDVITKEHILKLISKQKELNFNPGDEFEYCNTGFTLLAEVVSRISGMSFAEFTEANIFKPLKMSNTLFYDDHEKIVKNRAYSYKSDFDGYKKNVLSFSNVGATSLFSTVEDLSLWAMNFSDLTIGDSTIINTMNTLAVLNNGETFGGALGQFVGEYKGLKEVQHGGADAGYRSYITRFPDEDFAVIVFSNLAEFSSGRIAHKVVDIFLKDKMKIEDNEEVKENNASEGAKEFDKSSVNLSDFSGEFYSEELSITYNFTVVNDNLIVKHNRQSDFMLRPIKKDMFNSQAVFFGQFEFIRNANDEITGCKVSNGRIRNLYFEKID